MKRNKISALTLVFLFIGMGIVSAEETKTALIPVKNGFIEFNGLKYPIYAGIKNVNKNPEDGVYGSGFNYSLNTKTAKDAEKLAAKVIGFYKNKKIGTLVINGQFEKKTASDSTFYTSSNTGKDGSALTIMIFIEKTATSILFLPLSN